MESVQSFKVHQIVEHLKSRHDFVSDTEDMEDNGVQGVLRDYGIFVSLSKEEETLARAEVYALCEQNEFREVAHLVAKRDKQPGFVCTCSWPVTKRFYPQSEAAIRKVLLAQARMSDSPKRDETEV